MKPLSRCFSTPTVSLLLFVALLPIASATNFSYLFDLNCDVASSCGASGDNLPEGCCRDVAGDSVRDGFIDSNDVNDCGCPCSDFNDIVGGSSDFSQFTCDNTDCFVRCTNDNRESILYTANIINESYRTVVVPINDLRCGYSENNENNGTINTCLFLSSYPARGEGSGSPALHSVMRSLESIVQNIAQSITWITNI